MGYSNRKGTERRDSGGKSGTSKKTALNKTRTISSENPPSEKEGQKKPFKRGYNRKQTPFKKLKFKEPSLDKDNSIRLNKYIANAGVCSRREADIIIQSGAVSVNGKPVTELGTKIAPTDVVKYGKDTLRNERLMYLLLNKPKDYSASVDDPQKRKTVLDLIYKACKERIYPIGKMDKETTGLLLFTNDGDLTVKLTHPRHGVEKLYHVTTHKPIDPEHIKAMLSGVLIDGSKIRADKVEYVGDESDRHQIGVEIQSGKNKAIQYMMEALGYKIVKLDRVMYAGLTKKNLPKGHWRFLTEKEVSYLKMLG